jgi:hypothetical protein
MRLDMNAYIRPSLMRVFFKQLDPPYFCVHLFQGLNNLVGLIHLNYNIGIRIYNIRWLVCSRLLDGKLNGHFAVTEFDISPNF